MSRMFLWHHVYIQLHYYLIMCILWQQQQQIKVYDVDFSFTKKLSFYI